MIKNECGHAYKLLDHAECLWCENCVEKLIKKLSRKPEVTKEFVDKWYQVFLYMPMHLREKGLVRAIRQMLKEVNIEISVA